MVKEPTSSRMANDRVATLLPWARGKPMAWDVTVPDTYAESHISNTAREAGAAANRASASKTAEYGALSVSHIFVPVAVETAGTWGQSAIQLVQEIGKRTTIRSLRTLEKPCSCFSGCL